MSHYTHHLFFCLNTRSPDRQSCGASGNDALMIYAKRRVVALNLKPRVRVSQAGCLGRCQQGPCLVVYPEGIWYTIHTVEDVEAVLQGHIIGGIVVESLQMPISD